MKSVMFSKIIEILASILKKSRRENGKKKLGVALGCRILCRRKERNVRFFFVSSFSGVIKEAVTMDGLCCIEIKKTRGRQNRRKEPKSHLSST